MGCDIHMCLEIKYFKQEDKWYNADYFVRNKFYEVSKSQKKYEKIDLYGDRNYVLFAILANVRNDYDYEFISEARDVPKDISQETREEYEGFKAFSHSASYLSLKELLDYEKEHKTIKRCGMVSEKDAKRLDEEGELPNSWCKATNSPSFVYREWQDYNPVIDLIDKIKQRLAELFFIYDFEWEVDSEDLQEKSKNVRIVFWFDN